MSIFLYNTINYSYQINVSSICIKRYTCKNTLIICSNCRSTQICFHRTSLVLGNGPVSFLGASKFFWGASQFFWGASKSSNVLAPRATGPTSLMSRFDNCRSSISKKTTHTQSQMAAIGHKSVGPTFYVK